MTYIYLYSLTYKTQRSRFRKKRRRYKSLNLDSEAGQPRFRIKGNTDSEAGFKFAPKLDSEARPRI